jgi:hypothetical protein
MDGTEELPEQATLDAGLGIARATEGRRTINMS